MFAVGLLRRAVEAGLAGVALVDRDGHLIGKAGELDDDEAMPIASLVMMRAKEAPKLLSDRDLQNLSARLFAGEVLLDRLGDREVAVGVAGRQLFVVAVLGGADSGVVETLRRDVEHLLAHDAPFVPPSRGGGGGDSGPSELELIEYGITVPRAKA